MINKINFTPNFCALNLFQNNTENNKAAMGIPNIKDDIFEHQEFDLVDHPYIDSFERENSICENTGFCDGIDEFETFEDYGGLSDAYVV